MGPRGAGGGRRRRGAAAVAVAEPLARAPPPRPEPEPAPRRRRRDRSRSRSRGRRRRRSPSPRSREPTREDRERAALDKLRRERRPPVQRRPRAAAAAAQRRPPSPKRAMPPPPPRRPPTPPPRPPSPENDEAPPDFSFSCSQLVDRLLEVFNSDAPPQHRKAAIEQCFAEDGLSVAPLRAGKRPTAQQGMNAVESIVAASERLTEASPSIRVFMESGDEAESEPDPAHPTLSLGRLRGRERARFGGRRQGHARHELSSCGAA